MKKYAQGLRVQECIKPDTVIRAGNKNSLHTIGPLKKGTRCQQYDGRISGMTNREKVDIVKRGAMPDCFAALGNSVEAGVKFINRCHKQVGNLSPSRVAVHHRTL